MAEDTDDQREAAGLAARWERLSGRPDRTVHITDAQAIRAIAHEARQRVIDVLFTDSGRAFTATELAELTELTPSAMSYHLRALERWGVVERAESTGDARNRPWRAAGTRLEVRGGADPSARAAQSALFELAVDQYRERYDWYRSWPAERRHGFVGTGQAEFWLTEEEAARFLLALERAELELMESGVENRPGPGKIRTRWFFSLLPVAGERPPERAERPAGPEEPASGHDKEPTA